MLILGHIGYIDDSRESLEAAGGGIGQRNTIGTMRGKGTESGFSTSPELAYGGKVSAWRQV